MISRLWTWTVVHIPAVRRHRDDGTEALFGRSRGLPGRQDQRGQAPTIHARGVEPRGERVQLQPRLRVVPKHDVRPLVIGRGPTLHRITITGGTPLRERAHMHERPRLLGL